jgi:hypothetical protein
MHVLRDRLFALFGILAVSELFGSFRSSCYRGVMNVPITFLHQIKLPSTLLQSRLRSLTIPILANVPIVTFNHQLLTMPLPRPSSRFHRALKLSHSYAPRRTLQTRQFGTTRRCQFDDPRKFDPLKEWRNPKPSKWGSRLRLWFFTPLTIAIAYSVVRCPLPSLSPKPQSNMI